MYVRWEELDLVFCSEDQPENNKDLCQYSLKTHVALSISNLLEGNDYIFFFFYTHSPSIWQYLMYFKVLIPYTYSSLRIDKRNCKNLYSPPKKTFEADFTQHFPSIETSEKSKIHSLLDINMTLTQLFKVCPFLVINTYIYIYTISYIKQIQKHWTDLIAQNLHLLAVFDLNEKLLL